MRYAIIPLLCFILLSCTKTEEQPREVTFNAQCANCMVTWQENDGTAYTRTVSTSADSVVSWSVVIEPGSVVSMSTCRTSNVNPLPCIWMKLDGAPFGFASSEPDSCPTLQRVVPERE
jgi:hypothetical protein